MNEHLKAVSLALWTPGTDLAIDEAMIMCQGRAKETMTIPNKPIPTGFKLWVIAQLGYFHSWLFHMPGFRPLGVTAIPEISPTNYTAAIIPTLLRQLPEWDNGHYHIWLDNLFTSSKLLSYLHGKNVGASGTARPNSGIHQDILDEKTIESTKDQFEWGYKTIRYVVQSAVNTNNGTIMQMGWKDNSYCLFQSNCIDGLPDQVKLRRRPKKTSSKAKTSRVPFGSHSQAWLFIPLLVDGYNTYMNGVDRGDQLRASLPWRRHYQNWKALFFGLLGISIVNSYLLSLHSKVDKKAKYTRFTKFRKDLIQGLIEHGERLSTIANEFVNKKSERATIGTHEWSVRKQQRCVVCSRTQAMPLGKRSANHAAPKRPGGGCNTCNVNICKVGRCWDEFHCQ